MKLSKTGFEHSGILRDMQAKTVPGLSTVTVERNACKEHMLYCLPADNGGCHCLSKMELDPRNQRYDVLSDKNKSSSTVT